MHKTIEGKPLTDILARFVVETPGANVPSAAIDPAKDLILDTIGVALAAAPHPIGKTIIDYVTARRGAPASATVWGAGIRVVPEMAALANGPLANALDFDEGSHLPTHILPAALAVAEEQCLSGRDVLDAFIVGYEAGARVTQVIDARRRQQRGPTHQGWWHVGLVGPITAALTVCRLLKLDRSQAATAIGIAACGCGGFPQHGNDGESAAFRECRKAGGRGGLAGAERVRGRPGDHRSAARLSGGSVPAGGPRRGGDYRAPRPALYARSAPTD